MLAGAINTNVNALYALNALTNTANKASTLEQQLSSGQSISSPADNPAGYIAAQGFTAQIGGNEQAVSNVNQAISLVQTADGALTQQINLLQQIQNVANQAANGINSPQQLQSLQQVVSQLQTQVTTIAQQTVFNGQNLLDGSFHGVQFQVGASEGQTIGLSLTSTDATQLGANQSSAATTSSSIYVANGSGTGGVGDVSGNSYAITAAASGTATGAYTATGSTPIVIYGSGGNANLTVSAATESAHDVAASINALTPQRMSPQAPTPASRLPSRPARSHLPSATGMTEPEGRRTRPTSRRLYRACLRADCSRWSTRSTSRPEPPVWWLRSIRATSWC